MALPRDCYHCSVGLHEGHNATEGIVPGLIGGTICVCTGDCAERFEALKALFVQRLSRVYVVPPGQVLIGAAGHGAMLYEPVLTRRQRLLRWLLRRKVKTWTYEPDERLDITVRNPSPKGEGKQMVPGMVIPPGEHWVGLHPDGPVLYEEPEQSP